MFYITLISKKDNIEKRVKFMKIGVADYGMNVWDGGVFDFEQRLLDLKEIGYNGTERIKPINGEDAVNIAAMLKRMDMSFGTCLAPTAEKSIIWTAALGGKYVWTAVAGKKFDDFCRQVNIQAKACEKYGIEVAVHNHMGQTVESQEELEEFLKRCPTANIVFDTAHMAVAGGDCFEIVEKYYDRIQVLHVKDYISIDANNQKWFDRGRFCELGAGNIGLDNAEIVKLMVKKGYDGWIFVEHDTHVNEPLDDLKVSREYLRAAGV
jgi:inosose dehydratase